MSTRKLQPARATRHRVQRPRGAVYCRISEDGSGVQAGTTRQRKDCLKHCQQHGIEVIEVITDDDISASKYSRKKRVGYQRLLQMVDDGQIDTIVTWHMDRLYRQPRELEGLIGRIDDRSTALTVVTLNGDINLADSDGQMMARVMVAMAAKSSDDTSRRLKGKWADARENGEPPNSNCFGWRTRWVPEPTEAKLVIELADRALAGESLSSLAKDMNDRGIQTKRGGKWWPVTVRQILKAPRHAGLLRHEGEWVTGQWDPIIEPAKWHRLQATIARRGDQHRFARHAVLLTGLIYCGNCGKLMTRNGRADAAYLRCGTRVGQEGCGLSITYDIVEADIEAWALTLTDRENIGRAMLKMDGKDANADLTKQLTAAEQSQAELLNEVRLYNKSGHREGLRPALATPLLRELDEDIDRLRGQLAASSSEHGALSRYVQQRGYLRQVWEDDMPLDNKRAVLRELLAFRQERIVILPRTKGVPDEERITIEPLA